MPTDDRARSPRHYSGIVVFAAPAELERCREQLEALPGVEVRHLDPAGGRLVAVQETATLEQQQEGLRRIQRLPAVRLAALVEHRVDPAPDPTDPIAAPEPPGEPR